MGDSVGRFRDVWKGLEPKGQLAVVGSGLAVVVTFFLLYSFLSRPSYTPLLTGTDPSEAADVAKTLDAAGIRYRLANGGTEIDVQSGSESRAQVALAEKGLPKGGHVGFELFDQKSLGQTQFQQQVDYQRALEGEIARTLEQVQGVSAAQVQLVLPEDSLFADEGSNASASILLTGGSSLDAATVRGIAHLVAGSVKELKPDAVTITDETGALLWPTGDGGAGVSATSKLAAQERYSTQVAGAINALLAQTLGPNKAQARVHADLNVDQTTVDKVTYAKKGTPLKTQTDLETLQSKGGGGASAPAGVSSNVPTYGNAAGGGAGGNSNYKHQVDSTDFGVNKTVERTTVAPGAVNRLDVALLLDQSIPAAQAAAIQKTVAGVAGIDPKRGDTITVQRIAFAKQPEAKGPAAAGPLSDPLSLAKPVGIVLAALGFLLFARRGLKRRETDPVAAEPTWLREIEQQLTVAELERGPTRAALQAGEATIKDQVEDIVKREPEQIAAQIGQWLKE